MTQIANNKHIINESTQVRDVLLKFNKLGSDAILFLVDKDEKLLGSITDGDIRRGLIKGLGLENEIVNFVQPNPKFFSSDNFSLELMEKWRSMHYTVIPVVDENNRILKIVNFRTQRSYLPIDAVIMAGGQGTRLRPLTLKTPKPLLKVGGKPIVEYNIDRLNLFGIDNLTISLNYLGQQIIDCFGDGSKKEMNIRYVSEDEPLGTIGAVRLVENYRNDYILVMNSDVLTNIDFEDLFKELIENDGDMIVATTPYEVEIPYGVVETNGNTITSLKEKPTYTYYSNAGIYIIKKKHLDLIPKGEHFNATDLIDTLMKKNDVVLHYPILGYWLDIGKHHDFEKAQKDIKHIKF